MLEISNLETELPRIPTQFWKFYIANWLHTFVMTMAYTV